MLLLYFDTSYFFKVSKFTDFLYASPGLSELKLWPDIYHVLFVCNNISYYVSPYHTFASSHCLIIFLVLGEGIWPPSRIKPIGYNYIIVVEWWWWYSWNADTAHCWVLIVHNSNLKPFHLPSNLYYKLQRSRLLTCWSLRCSWSIACQRCSNYIFILDLTPGFNGFGKDYYMMRWETFKFWDLVHFISET